MHLHLQLAKIYGILAAALSFFGLFASGHLLGLTNSDPALDLLRLALAGLLLYAGFVSKSYESVTAALLIAGTLLLSIGLYGLIMPDLGALLPSKLTSFDITFHLFTGGLATLFGMQSRERYTVS